MGKDNSNSPRIVNISFLFTAVVLIFISLFVYLSAFSVIHKDIGFNTDLARDFLLLENIQQTHKVTLIGPRSGGIPGVFHGPLWIYLNLPAYVVGHGDPVVVGWFWIILVTISIGIVYFVGRKVFGHIVGLLAAILVALNSITFASSLFNPYGAVMISPLFLYFFYKYFLNKKFMDLTIMLFIVGIIIQFQVAFGFPLLILSSILIFYLIIKNRKFSHILSFLILIVPFSTYALFDLRHNFLESRALIAYMLGKTGGISDFTFINLLQNRLDGIINSLVMVAYPSMLVILITVLMFAYVLYKSFRSKEKYSRFVLLFAYFFIGYWAITFLFKGVVWGYYFWPFMPIVAIITASALKFANKYVFLIFFLIISLSSFIYSFSYVNYLKTSFISKDGGSWQFNYNLAQSVFDQKDSEFGYYIFSPDEYGYSPKYAMNYLATKNPDIKAMPYTKSETTYLLVSPPGGKNSSIGGEWWKINRVKINSKPVKIINFKNGFKVEKYNLSAEEISVSADPNLIDTLIFR